MPQYKVKFGHYLILEAAVVLDAPDRTKAREIAENGVFRPWAKIPEEEYCVRYRALSGREEE